MKANDFPQHLPWINTPHPLRLSTDLQGHVVLLHFWAYTCIHSRNTLADISQLRQKFAGRPFVVIGVHTGKYQSNERAIRAAVLRDGIAHPVVIDPHHELWKTYNVNSWPTMVLIGADGVILGTISGEGHRPLLEATTERALTKAARAGHLAQHPLEICGASSAVPPTDLAFPAKILADAPRRRLIVIDSLHHRIVVSNWPDATGNAPVQQIIGTGKPGLNDGDLATATFRAPEGAALSAARAGSDILWLADTGNHCVRRIDLAAGRVTTVLGTGAPGFDNEAGKSGREQPLNSPRDVASFANRLYISQAGQHQIFAMNLMTGMAEVACGTARESWCDGDSHRAYLGQPSGLALDTHRQILYFADAENSAIRSLDLRTRQMRTIVGRGMFEFGDIDGPLAQARLQHCLGLALSADGSEIFVADTGNHKIKLIDLNQNRITTLANPAGGEWFEPASVAVGETPDTGVEIFAADTGNHRILRYTPRRTEWTQLAFDGL